MTRNRMRAKFKDGKMKIIDENGRLIDSVHPTDLIDTLDLLQQKYGKKHDRRS